MNAGQPVEREPKTMITMQRIEKTCRNRLRMVTLLVYGALALTGCSEDSTAQGPDGQIGIRDSAPVGKDFSILDAAMTADVAAEGPLSGDGIQKPDGMKSIDGPKKSDGMKSIDGPKKSDSGPKSEIPNDFGFIMRVPQAHTLQCKEPLGGYTNHDWSDTDWICTFVHGTISGYIYIQDTPTSCKYTGLGFSPTFTTGTAVINVGGKITPLTSAVYDWGGGHHNDYLTFLYSQKSYKYYHSSFGPGMRKCQPMDCMQVYQPSGTLITDGCTSARTLPVVCLAVEKGKTYGATSFKDTFKKCQ